MVGSLAGALWNIYVSSAANNPKLNADGSIQNTAGTVSTLVAETSGAAVPAIQEAYRGSRSSPIRLSPIGHSPMAKVWQYHGESTVDSRQLARVLRGRWRKYRRLSPIGECPAIDSASRSGLSPIYNKRLSFPSNE